MRSIAAVVAVMAMTAPQDPPRPVFRSGIDLVTVDAIVVDSLGRPITDLTAGDFAVTAAGRQRKVVSAEFVPIVISRPAAPAAPEAPPIAESSSNVSLRESRSFLVVVDVEQIDSGGGMATMRSAMTFVATLGRDDRVGVVALPNGTPRVDLTTNRAVVKRALGSIVGAGQRDTLMSIGEAVAIERGDRVTLQEWADRTNCADPRYVSSGFDVPLTPDCRRTARALAEQTLRQARRHSRDLLDSLRQMASAMAPVRGLKTIVLVSQGMLRDGEAREDLRRFAEAAAAARVTLYSLVLDTPQTLASDGMMRPPDRGADAALNTAGMADAANAAGGEMFRVSGTADAALGQIDTQLTGYYLLSFESDPGDAGDRRRTIAVDVRRPAVTVRARSDFAIPGVPARRAAPPSPPKDLRGQVGELIRWPVPVADVPMELGTFQAASAHGAQAHRVIIVGELPPDVRPGAAGYEISDEKGKVIADSFELDPKVESSAARTTYAAGVELPPGQYRLKFAVVGADARRGSIEHAFAVDAPPAGPLRLGDIFVGFEEDEHFHPIVRIPPDVPQVAVQIEVQAAAAASLANVSVVLDVARRGAPAPLASAQMRIETTPDPLKRVAAAKLTVSRLEAGEYVVRATLTGSSPLQQVTRLIRKR